MSRQVARAKTQIGHYVIYNTYDDISIINSIDLTWCVCVCVVLFFLLVNDRVTRGMLFIFIFYRRQNYGSTISSFFYIHITVCLRCGLTDLFGPHIIMRIIIRDWYLSRFNRTKQKKEKRTLCSYIIIRALVRRIAE